MAQDAPTIVAEAVDSYDIVVIHFYRGRWCPVCKTWLQKYTSIPAYNELRGKASVCTIAISSESAGDAEDTKSKFGLDGVEDLVFVNDPENAVATKLNEELVSTMQCIFLTVKMLHGRIGVFGIAIAIFLVTDSSLVSPSLCLLIVHHQFD